jgi:AcrR family transcriptional regulator
MLSETQAALLPPRVDTNGTLRRIYEEALTRFAERGYHGVSMRDIADACGIQASSIYAHVDSKEQILHDLVLMGHEDHRDRIRDALLEAGAEPADQLRAVVGAHVRYHAEYPVLATVVNNELHALTKENAHEIEAIRAEDVRLIMDVIERGVKLGHFRCSDAYLATAVIGAAGIRVAAWYRPGNDVADRYTVEDIVEQYAELALKLVS